jgi:hypothetical protein
VLGPGAITSLFFGQTGTLAAALFLGALLFAGRRPVASGVAAGLLSVKPQLGILLPVCLLAARHWLAIAIAAVAALVTVVAASALFGWDIYPLYFAKAAPVMRAIMEAPFPQSYHANAITVFLTARALGASVPMAYVVQGLAAIGCAVVAWRLWRGPCADPLMRVAATACLALLATPYGYTYDMVAYSFACAVMFDRADWKFRAPLLLLWIWPSLSAFVTGLLFPVTPAPMLIAAVLASRPLLQRRAAPAS